MLQIIETTSNIFTLSSTSLAALVYRKSNFMNAYMTW